VVVDFVVIDPIIQTTQSHTHESSAAFVLPHNKKKHDNQKNDVVLRRYLGGNGSSIRRRDYVHNRVVILNKSEKLAFLFFPSLF
jgi:hypothetical protein